MKIIPLALICFNLFASNISRIEEAFKESFKNRDLECSYFQAKENILISPISMTLYDSQRLSREFIIATENKDLKLKFEIFNDENSKYRLAIEDVVFEGDLNPKLFAALMEFGDGGFFASSLLYKSGNKNHIKDIDLSKVKCNLELAKSKPIHLTGVHHVNVHPHSRYDYLGLLSEPVNRYFKEMDSYVLIDGPNRQGAYVNYFDFLKTGEYTTFFEAFDTPMEIPEEVPFIISPAGYNDYTFIQNGKVDIYLTGGNHNYCIWNNTRNLMWGLFYSKSSADLTIYYDTGATVVQRAGIIPGTSFKKKEVKGSNVLKTIFENNPQVQKNYHNAYNYYFQKDFILRFTGLFKTLSYTYKAEGFEVTETIKGKGTRDLNIALIYL